MSIFLGTKKTNRYVRAIASRLAALALIITATSFATAHAQVPDETPIEDVSVSLPPMSDSYSDEAFEAYIDGVVDEAMKEGHAAGLTLSIVRGGQLRVLKGYGYADVEKQIAVDPKLHSFRIGSVSKTFNYILAMQLVEEGKLDLEADVNTYLTAFKLPDTYDTPIKLKDLLSHRSGLDVVLQNLFVETPDDFMSLETWLKDNVPPQVRAPGTLSNYDNYGVALLGYIVQEVSGELFEDRLERKILKPLQMNHSTARQKVRTDDPRNMPENLAQNTATAYFWKGGRFVPSPYELVPAAPAGSMTATADDMARYMLANLNEMSLNGVSLLKPATARSIRERLYPGRPSADFAHGFRNGKFEGYDTFEHGGATQATYTTMILIPDLDIGIFTSTNGTQNGTQVQSNIANRVLTKMVGSAAKPRPQSLEIDDTTPYTGSYIVTRRTHENALKILSLAGGTASISATDRGTLLVSAAGEADEYERIGEHTFQKLRGDEVISFEIGDDGTATHFHAPYGHVAMERIPGDSKTSSLFIIAGLAALLALTQFISAWKRRSEPNREKNKYSLVLSVLLLLVATFVLLSLAYIGLTLMQMDSLANRAIFEWPLSNLKILNWATLLLTLSTAFVLLGLYHAMTQAGFSIWRKIHYVLFAIILVLLVLKLNDWNLISFKY